MPEAAIAGRFDSVSVNEATGHAVNVTVRRKSQQQYEVPESARRTGTSQMTPHLYPANTPLEKVTGTSLLLKCKSMMMIR